MSAVVSAAPFATARSAAGSAFFELPPHAATPTSAHNTTTETVRVEIMGRTLTPRDEVFVDHAVHLEDVPLLSGVEPSAGPARGVHPLLHVCEVLVVLLRDLA